MSPVAEPSDILYPTSKTILEAEPRRLIASWAVIDPEANFYIGWREYLKKAKRNQEAPANGNSFTSNSERLLD